MSRNSYEFVSTDADEILDEITEAYIRYTGYTPKPADPETLFLRWMAAVLAAERVNQNYAANQNIPSRAFGDNLDALGETIFGTKRISGTAAHCTVRFVISQAQTTAILIPKGARVTDALKTYVWEVAQDTFVPIGDTSVDVPVVCQTVGTAPNDVQVGEICVLVDVDKVLYYLSCANITAPAGGSDAETDDEYYARLQASLDRFTTAGPKGAYEYWAKTASGEIADVKAVCPNSPCVVNIYTLMNDGTPAGAELKSAILAICNDEAVRPLTDVVTCDDPLPVSYDINLTFYIDRASARSASDIEADVNAAVDAYVVWQRARFGRDLNPSVLQRDIMAVDGVKRVNVVSPAFTVVEAGDALNTPQYAVLGTRTVTNGGYEDE